ncbi:MAG: TetR family transcriptional regulator [Rhodobiaceae bacterium]|nr:MAG: TetR family transcriptional regulator [Rhodobiaceae bacterium]
MKTRDRILQASLALFNEEGETNVSTVDIANQVDISPGNLYYHFKGKDALIAALYEAFEEEMRIVLTAPVDTPLRAEDNWLYFYIVFEEIFDFRFFYRNLTDLLTRYPQLNARFQDLLERKQATCTAMLSNLGQHGILDMQEYEVEQTSTRLTMLLTYWLNFEAVRHPNASGPDIIHGGVFHVLSHIAPYFSGGRQVFTDVIATLYEDQIADAAKRRGR